MSFLLSFFSFFTVLTTQIEWLNFRIDVPLYEDIEEYRYIPQANLYINGIKVSDPLMYYETNAVDHTFFSVISTSYIRTYTIRYRVVFPTKQIEDTHDIIFNIIDLTPPQILAVKEFEVPLGQTITDFKEGLIISDNYDSNSQLTTSIDTLNVIWNRVGTYQIYYQVSDTSGNFSSRTTTVEIYDYLPPEIVQKKLLIIPYGSTFNWSDFLVITDNDDPFPNVSINDLEVDYFHLGSYELSVTATDRNGLSTSLSYQLSIIDNVPPVINTRSSPLPISVFTNPTDINLRDYILSITDNYDDLNSNNLIITDDIEYDVVGIYEVTFYIEDSSGNSVSKKMTIQVVDDEKPIISLLSTMQFDVFDIEPLYIEFIEYSDNYTDHDLLTIKFTESVNMNKVGKYLLTIEVSDTSKNKTILNSYVYIVDTIPPEISQINDILITDFVQKPLDFYFVATDNYDLISNISIIIDDHEIIYDQIGSYPLYVDVIDMSLNQITLVTEVNVLDIIEPVLMLSKTSTSVEVFSNPIDLTSFIIEATDNYDVLTIEDVTITHQIDYEKIGVYLVTYSLMDSSMNKIEKYMYVTIDDLTPPSAVLPSITLQINDYFDPLLGITVEDNLNEVEIHVFPEQLDTSLPGIKEVTYVILDSRGNYTTKIREIIIEDTHQSIPLTQYIPVLIVTIIGGGICYYIYKKMI